MSPQVLIILGEGYKATLQLWGQILEAMPEDKREAYAAMIAEREIWWQEHVWRKLGDLIAGDELDIDA